MSNQTITRAPHTRPMFLLRLFVPFALGYFLADLYRSVNAVLAPDLISEFDLNASQLGFMTSSFFLGFAIVQLPLGIALDRFGARRTLAATLMFGAAGAVLFSIADNVSLLVLGRGLIGIGVGGCLMSALKAFAESVSYRRLPIINSLLTFVGGIGVMTATKPLYFSLQFVDWRGVFVILAVATAAVSLLIFFASPERSKDPGASVSIREQIRGFAVILKSPQFVAILPIATFVQATYLSLDTLWVGTWFKDIPGFSPDLVSSLLLVVSIALTAGYLMNGLVGGWLQKFGVDIQHTALVAIIGFTVILGGIGAVTPLGGVGGTVLWPLMIFLGPFVLLFYPVLTNMFDPSLTGRVLTLYNLMVFLVSFALQYLLGIVIDLWPSNANEKFSTEGYTAGLFIIFGIHVLSLIWLFAINKKNNSAMNTNA